MILWWDSRGKWSSGMRSSTLRDVSLLVGILMESHSSYLDLNDHPMIFPFVLVWLVHGFYPGHSKLEMVGFLCDELKHDLVLPLPRKGFYSLLGYIFLSFARKQ